MEWNEFFLALGQTVAMTLIAAVLAYLVGLPLGVLLYTTGKKGLHPNRVVNFIVGLLVNILRSIPCLLLIIILIPLNRGVFGRATGEWYTMIIPLFFASFAYVGRVVETSLNEVDQGVVEAARSMGASSMQIIVKVLLTEARPSLLLGVALSTISILGYTAFAYDFGAGGLIARAYSIYSSHPINYLSRPDIWVILALIVVVVQVIQEVGLLLSKKTDKRRIAK
ncbi:MAG: ABC transporter permease subunit [Bacilli bacterium]|nr:ABC transporter permease subunit [Bacilli bacterium]